MYTVTFIHVDGTNDVSRYFETVRAARTWSKWLLTMKWVKEITIYRGQAGAELLERKAR